MINARTPRIGRSRSAVRTAVSLAALLSCAACAPDMTPIVLSSQFTPPSGSQRPAAANMRGQGSTIGPCRVYLADIRDLRLDPQSLGSVGTRPVRTTDAVAWLRSGFQSLSRSPQIRVVEGEDAGDADLTLRVELINAYVMSITQLTRAASIVVRVQYDRAGSPPDNQVYRGSHDALNWVSAEEARSSFNAALAEILTGVDRDVLTRCSLSSSANAK